MSGIEIAKGTHIKTPAEEANLEGMSSEMDNMLENVKGRKWGIICKKPQQDREEPEVCEEFSCSGRLQSNFDGDDGNDTKEVDPSGLKQGDKGAKFDSGKIRVSLLKRFGLALLAVGDLATSGASKYTAHGWAEVENGIDRYDDALLGHYLKEMFEDRDPDMRVKHEVQTAWNALAKLQLMVEAEPEWKERLMKRIATGYREEK